MIHKSDEEIDKENIEDSFAEVEKVGKLIGEND